MPFKLLFGTGLAEDVVVETKAEAMAQAKQYLRESEEENVSFRDTESGYDYGLRFVHSYNLDINGNNVRSSQFSLVSLTSENCCGTGDDDVNDGDSDNDGEQDDGLRPSWVDDLMLWLKADSLNLEDNTLVKLWPDSSNNNHNATQDLLALQPTYKTAQVNALPCIRFVTGKNFEIKNFIGAFSEGEIFWVLKSGLGGGLHSFGASGVLNAGCAVYPPASDGKIQEDFGRTVRTPLVTPTKTVTTWRVYNVTAKAGNWNNTLDDVFQYAYAITATTWAGGEKIYIGRNSATPILFFGGDIAEVILYRRVLTTEEHKGVKEYLDLKYGLKPVVIVPQVAEPRRPLFT